VDVLCVDLDAAVGAQTLQRRLERDVRRAYDDADARRVRRDASNLRRAWWGPLNIFQFPATSI
jgi:hypothetical protein